MKLRSKIIREEIEKITKECNLKIRNIEGINRYQKLYGKIKLDVDKCTDRENSIVYKFENNTSLIEFPRWSYEVLLAKLARRKTKCDTVEETKRQKN